MKCVYVRVNGSGSNFIRYKLTFGAFITVKYDERNGMARGTKIAFTVYLFVPSRVHVFTLCVVRTYE